MQRNKLKIFFSAILLIAMFIFFLGSVCATESCHNKLDDDGDGYIDMEDFDCGLVVNYWNFNGNYYDPIGNNLGTAFGDAHISDNTLALNGNGYVNVPSSSSINYNAYSEHTWSFWVKGSGGLISKGDLNSKKGYSIYIDKSGKIFFSDNNNTQNNDSCVLGAFDTSSWHNVVIGMKGRGVNLYCLDGGCYCIHVGNSITLEDDNLSSVKIGYANGIYFNGSIDDVMIFSRTFGLADIGFDYIRDLYSIQKERRDREFKSKFVGVNGSDFYFNNSKFYFAGTNAYYLWYSNKNSGCVDNGAHQGCLIPLLDSAKALNLTVIRTWGSSEGSGGYRYGYNFQPTAGIYNENTFVQMDKVIKEAKDRNIKLIIALTNNWDSFGGMCQYVKWCGLPNANLCQAGESWPFPNAYVHDSFYTNDCIKQLYKNYISYFLNRTNTLTGVKYKDEPAIFAWELANEPRARSDKNCTIINDWIGEMSSFVKSIDNNHLVTAGVDGGYKNKIPDFNNWWYQCNEGQDYIANHNWNTIDFATYNYYDDSNRFDVNQTRWLYDHINEAHNTLGKPVVLQEFNTINSSGRGQILSQWFSKFQDWGLNGDTIWMLSDFRGADADGFEFLCPQDSAICNALLNHANFMNNKSGNQINQTPAVNCTILYSGMNITKSTTFCKGNYSLNDSINIRANNVVLDCNGAVLINNKILNSVGINVFNNSISIKNCRIEDYDLYGIDFKHSNYNNLINNTFIDNYIGINFGGYYQYGNSKYNNILNNRFINSTIMCYHSSNNIFSNNNISDKIYGVGFYLHDTKNSKFINNSVNGCYKGFNIWWGSYYNEFINNTIVGMCPNDGECLNHNPYYGFYFDWLSDHNVFTGNKVYNNWAGFYHEPSWYGVMYNGTFVFNDVRNNSYGFYLGATNDSIIRDNNITGNRNCGINLYNSFNNKIYSDNFIDNWDMVRSYNSINFFNSSNQGNYWSNYSTPAQGCYDTNSNGICDNPYNIDNNNKDYFPFTLQNGWLNKANGMVKLISPVISSANNIIKIGSNASKIYIGPAVPNVIKLGSSTSNKNTNSAIKLGNINTKTSTTNQSPVIKLGSKNQINNNIYTVKIPSR